MSVETGEGDGSPKVSVLPLRDRLIIRVKMLLGQAKIDDVYSAILTIEHKVGGLHVSMDEAALVHFLDRDDHLNEDMDGDFEVVTLFQAASSLGQVDTEQVHHDEVLLAIHDVIVRIWHVLQSYSAKTSSK